MNKPSLNALTRLVGRARVLPVLVVVTTAASVGVTVVAAPAAGASAITSGSGIDARSACAHRPGGPGLVGYEGLIEDGWTIGEKNGLIRALAHFAQRVCPQPGIVDVETTTYLQKHIDNETVWQDTFRIVAAPSSRHYLITADLPSLDSMSITIKSVNGAVLYRSGRIDTPEG
jgi:hypothetical protein